MACGVGRHRGGIAGLVRLLSEYGEAVEYDLITLGLRLDDLGTRRLSWRDLLVIVSNAPQHSALVRAKVGERSEWTLPVRMLADIFDLLAGANWQRSGTKGNRPKPYPRPVDPATVKKWGSGPKPIEEINALLGWTTVPTGV